MSTTLDETANTERDDLIEKAAAFAASRKGSGGPPGRHVGRAAAVLLPPRRRRGPRRAHRGGPVRRRDEPVQAGVVPAAGHREHPGLHPDRRRARLVRRRAHGRRGGHRRHAVPRRLGDDGAQRAEPRGAHGRAPADPGPPRHHRAAAGDLHRRRPAGRPGRRSRTTSPASRGCTSRSAASRAPAQREEIEQALVKVLQDVREAVEDWPKMHQQALDIIEDLDEQPAAAAGRGDRRGPGAAALAGRHPLHVPRLPRVPPRGRSTTAGRRRAARRARHRLRHPARRPGHVRVVRASCRRWCGPRPARRPCWCWPRPTPRRPCTGRSTSTTSASRRSTRAARSSASAASSGCSRRPPTPSR